MTGTTTDRAEHIAEDITRSHERLADLVRPLIPDAVDRPSYASEWSIADVLSHLGSGAVIFGLYVDAGRAGAAAPGQDVLQPIWDEWNAKSALDKATDAIRADAEFVDKVSTLDSAARDCWRLELFGGRHDLAAVLRMRLAEHVVHTWDIAVSVDDDATLGGNLDAVLENAMLIAAFVCRPLEKSHVVEVRLHEPSHRFVLAVGPSGAALTTEPDPHTNPDASLDMPAESFIRLVYGRLDDHVTPTSVRAEDVTLEELRQAFPGV